MPSITHFVAAYERNSEKYSAIKERVEALCKDRLQGISLLQEFRVKDPASLEKKLRKRSKQYKNEAANVADICDLVGGRLVLARDEDIHHVERIVKETFNFIKRFQHPKHSQDKVDSNTRFRGYGGLHLYVKLPGGSEQQLPDPFIEIQVMTSFMWAYVTLHHDVVYKQQHGKPTAKLLLLMDLLRGIMNLGEISLKIYDERFHQQKTHADVQTRVRSVVGQEAFVELEARSQRGLQLTNSQHDNNGAELSTGERYENSVLEERAYALVRKHISNKEAHLVGVAEARQVLLQAMPMSSQNDLRSTCHLRRLRHLAVAERKLSLQPGLDAGTAEVHLNQAEAYLKEAVGLDTLSELVGAREQMTLERHIVGGLRANLEFRTGVKDADDTRRLLSDAVAGIYQALGDLERVDNDKHGKNMKYGFGWVRYFSNASY